MTPDIIDLHGSNQVSGQNRARGIRDLNFAAGNEEGLVDPDACLIDRLVRLELRLLLEELLRRTTAVQLDSGAGPAVEGLTALPIRLFT